MKLRLLLLLLVAGTLSQTALATQKENGKYVWQFLSGEPWPSGYNQNIGKPDNLMWKRNEYTDAFFQRINNALPEAKINEAFITDDEGSTIHLTESAEVFVTFLHEGAGYKNAFGFFTFDKNNPPTSREQVQETIVFPNLSFPHMTNGHRLSLGTFPAGTSIGFFIAANGFNYYTGVKTYEHPFYYTLQDLNPEADPGLRQHAVLLYDNEVSEVIIGFEDLPRTWGDNDFNDAVFSVKSTPETAIEAASLVAIPDADDSDADGVPDDDDEFPNDYRRTDSTYFPAQHSFATLAYEDNWPNLGDFDFNDLVIKQRTRFIYDAQGTLTGLIIDGKIMARGAARPNGFALRLIDVPAQEIRGIQLSIQDNVYNKSVDDYQQDAVVRLWRNSLAYTQTGETGKCSHFNTHTSCNQFEPVDFSLDINFHNGLASLPVSSLDFFIFRTNDYSHEVHLPDYAPTDWFNPSRFGRSADTSDPEQQRFFRTSNNLPWAVQLTVPWEHPREYLDILWAYPKYESWVESGGLESVDWYANEKRSTHVYSIASGEDNE